MRPTRRELLADTVALLLGVLALLAALFAL